MSGAPSTSGQNYAYGYGRIGVLQQYLLNQGDIDRLIGAHSERELFRILSELNFTKGIEPTNDPREIIKRMELWLMKEVAAMSGSGIGENVFDILWLRNDAALLSYLLKQYHGLTSDISSEPEVGATAYDVDALKLLVKHGHAELGLTNQLVSFVRDIKDRKQATPQEIDDAVAQFVATEQVRLATSSGSEHIIRYVAHHIDLQNIRTARRLRKGDNPEDHLLKGGRIPAQDISPDPQQLAILIRSSHLPSELADYLADTEEASLALERGLARAIAHDIALMRNEVLTIEPLFAFAAIAQSQLKVLRTIIIGKVTGLTAEELAGLLPPFLSTSPFTA
jgi:vacuolar-type H+-ATPase subunit C/Vma6